MITKTIYKITQNTINHYVYCDHSVSILFLNDLYSFLSEILIDFQSNNKYGFQVSRVLRKRENLFIETRTSFVRFYFYFDENLTAAQTEQLQNVILELGIDFLI